jgi:hypothetical protein
MFFSLKYKFLNFSLILIKISMIILLLSFILFLVNVQPNSFPVYAVNVTKGDCDEEK